MIQSERKDGGPAFYPNGISIEHAETTCRMAYDASLVRFWITLPTGQKLYFYDMEVSDWDSEAEIAIAIDKHKKALCEHLILFVDALLKARSEKEE